MLANVLLAGEVCQTLSGPADGNICSVLMNPLMIFIKIIKLR